MKVRYARVSTKGQNLDMQMDALNGTLGVELGVVFLEQINFIYYFNKLDALLNGWYSHRMGFMGKNKANKDIEHGI